MKFTNSAHHYVAPPVRPGPSGPPMDGSSPWGPSAPARDSDSPASLSRHSMARAPPFGPRASPRLRLRPCTSADSVAPQATVHLSRPGTILPPPHSVAAYAAPLGPCFLPLRLPPAPPAASHLRQCLAQCLPHIHGLGAFSQHSHCRSTHPSDRAGPRGSPSLGRPGVRASVTSPPTGLAPAAPQSRTAWTALPSSRHRQFGFRRPASHSAGSVHIPVTSPPTGPAHGAAPDSDGLDGPTVVCVSSNPHMGRT